MEKMMLTSVPIIFRTTKSSGLLASISKTNTETKEMMMVIIKQNKFERIVKAHHSLREARPVIK